MATFSEEIVIFAALTHGLADQLLAGGVTLGRIDHVEAGIERFIEQGLGGFNGDAFIAYFRSAEAENAYTHIRFAEFASFHRSLSSKIKITFSYPS